MNQQEPEEQRVSITVDEYHTLELFRELCSFGWLDIQAAVYKLDAYDISYGEFAQYIEDFCKECEIQLQDMDICAQVYEYVLQEARRRIEDATGKDICNDFDIYVYGNYMCSTYDKCESTMEFMKKQFKKGKLDKEDKMLTLFFEDIGGTFK